MLLKLPTRFKLIKIKLIGLNAPKLLLHIMQFPVNRKVKILAALVYNGSQN
jgi:hypothetical protein